MPPLDELISAQQRLFHQRTLEVLEVVGASAVVMAHHALSAGLDHDIFCLSLDGRRESLRISAVSEAIICFELALRFVQEASQQEMSEETKLRDLYLQQSRVDKLSGQNGKAWQMETSSIAEADSYSCLRIFNKLTNFGLILR